MTPVASLVSMIEKSVGLLFHRVVHCLVLSRGLDLALQPARQVGPVPRNHPRNEAGSASAILL
jgi:hypothetical protein